MQSYACRVQKEKKRFYPLKQFLIHTVKLLFNCLIHLVLMCSFNLREYYLFIEISNVGTFWRTLKGVISKEQFSYF